jgi:hypothetical protein
MTNRPKRRWYGVTVAWGMEVTNEKMEEATGFDVEMYAAGDIRT